MRVLLCVFDSSCGRFPVNVRCGFISSRFLSGRESNQLGLGRSGGGGGSGGLGRSVKRKWSEGSELYSRFR